MRWRAALRGLLAPSAPPGAAITASHRPDPARPVRRVLVTGASGQVAGLLMPWLAQSGFELRPADLRAGGDARADLTQGNDCERVVRGVDAVLHLAGFAGDAPLGQLLAPNVLATQNLLDASIRAGVGHFVLASSMHVLGLYPRDAAVDEASPPWPDSAYATSKLHAEALCRLAAERHGLALTCVRIGALGKTIGTVEPGSWIGPRDLAAMVAVALRRDRAGFEIFHAVADAEGSPLPPSRATAFGWRCTEPGEPYADSLARAAKWWPHDEWARTRRGSSFASPPRR